MKAGWKLDEIEGERECYVDGIRGKLISFISILRIPLKCVDFYTTLGLKFLLGNVFKPSK